MPNPKVLFKFGTRAEYDALETKQNNALYYLLDTNELYRGTVPFNKPHIYKGPYGNAADLDAAIATIVGSNPIIQGDFVIITNQDNSQDAYVWSEDEENWIHIGNTNTDSLSQRVIVLEGAVADLNTALYGDEEDPNDDGGIDGRLTIVEDLLASSTGGPIPIFNGTISGLVPVPDSLLTDAEKARLFLNGMGHWVQTSGGEGGQTTYVDPEGNTYNNVEDYVTYMINNYGQSEWQSIDG